MATVAAVGVVVGWCIGERVHHFLPPTEREVMSCTSHRCFPSSSSSSSYAYGMMWVLMVGTAWLLVASYYGWNVSSTHSIIGGILGFAIIAKGEART